MVEFRLWGQMLSWQQHFGGCFAEICSFFLFDWNAMLGSSILVALSTIVLKNMISKIFFNQSVTSSMTSYKLKGKL